jgi:hypothetical protein
LEREAKADGQLVVPFWMAGSHYIIAWGRANKSQPMLFFVDTGLGGSGFTCPRSTVEQVGIRLLEERAREGAGAGGKIRVVPFVLDELTLGGASEQRVPGLFGSFPEGLEHAKGFRIAGIISHAFFRPYAVTFDFGNMRLLLRRRA